MAPGCLSAAILIILAGLCGYMQALNLSTIASVESFLRERKRLVNMLFLNVSGSRKNLLRRRKRGWLRHWIRQGRTKQWWHNYINGTVVAEEWKENFRMSKPSFMELCEELRPLLEKKDTRKKDLISGRTSSNYSLLFFRNIWNICCQCIYNSTKVL